MNPYAMEAPVLSPSLRRVRDPKRGDAVAQYAESLNEMPGAAALLSGAPGTAFQVLPYVFGGFFPQ